MPFTYGGQTYSVPLGTLSGAASNVADYWQWTGRVDHRFNEKHTLMGRYMFDDRVSTLRPGSPAGPDGLHTGAPPGSCHYVQTRR